MSLPIIDARFYGMSFSDALILEPRLAQFIISSPLEDDNRIDNLSKCKKIKFDLGNSAFLRLYNTTVLREKYQILLQLPDISYLIPTVGVRMAFLSVILKNHHRHVLEIGIGSTAILSLLMAKHYNCQVIGTDTNPQALILAKSQINLNCLNIETRDSKGKILENVIKEGEKFDIVISYPPMYPRSKIDETIRLSKPRGFLGKQQELYLPEKYFLLQFIFEFWRSKQIKELAILLLNRKQLNRLLNFLRIISSDPFCITSDLTLPSHDLMPLLFRKYNESLDIFFSWNDSGFFIPNNHSLFSLTYHLCQINAGNRSRFVLHLKKPSLSFDRN